MKIKEIVDILKKIPEVLAKKAFSAFLFFLLLIVLFCGIIFYYYYFLADSKAVSGLEPPTVINEESYRKVVDIWNEKEVGFQKADSKKYYNPFIKPASLIETPPK